MGDTKMKGFSAMINLIGEGGAGPASIHGMEALLEIPNTYIHLYGKAETRNGRKMGHVTILGDSLTELQEKIARVKEMVRIIPTTNTELTSAPN